MSGDIRETTDGPVLLLDGASMWFRSFFGVPSSITAPDGRPVNALRGFLDAVATLITRHRPSRLVVCLDLDWRPQWRVDLIPSYKAHRVEQESPGAAPDVEVVPDDLSPQVDMIMAMLDAFGIATAGAPGYEADDVLGTLATGERRNPVVVVSGDRDLLQLVGDEHVPVRVLYIGRGLAKATLFGPAEVADQYGVPIDRAGRAYAELALLRGDPSDGLPGVPGIGEKTAATLISRFGSVEGLLAALDDPHSALAAGMRAKLRAARAYLELAPAVVRVATGAAVQQDRDDTLPSAPADPRALTALQHRWGLGTTVNRLVAALQAQHFRSGADLRPR
jgi:5'-3' exonuclease